MTVVAEGVETIEQHRAVAALDCDSCQGNYFALPLSASAVGELLQQGHCDAYPRLPATARSRNDDASAT